MGLSVSWPSLFSLLPPSWPLLSVSPIPHTGHAASQAASLDFIRQVHPFFLLGKVAQDQLQLDNDSTAIGP